MARHLAVTDWLLAHDPALSRARMGARVTLTILLSIALLILFHALVMPLPPIAYGLSIILSIEGGVAVRDRLPREQLKTRIIGCLASLSCIAIAALLEDYRLMSDLVFLGVIFAASLARIYGPRGFAVGMFAFTSYFIGAYLKPEIAQLPLAALGPVVAVAIGHLVRTYIVTDDRKREILQALIAVQGRTSDILGKLELISASGRCTEADRLALQRLEERLKEVVLMAESSLPLTPEGEGGDAASETPATIAAMKIFDLHLAAESAIVLSLESLPPPGLVEAVLNGDAARVAHFADDPAEDDQQAASETRRALKWLHEARQALSAEIERIRRQGPHGLEMAPSSSLRAKPDFSLKNPLVRAALQITIASGIAMIFGLMLSRERWFWSVLTAFLVFNNTKSRGDTAVRAIQRSIGTLLGIAIGLGAATLLAGHPAPAVVLASICVFLAFYFLQVSYAVMSFFVTIVLCLIYGLIGQLTLDLLLLRLEETLIGALAGTFVAFVVLPASTRSSVERALLRWYDVLRQMLAAAEGGKGRLELIEMSRRLDAAYRELTLAAKPLGTSWSMVTKPGQIRQTLAVFLASTYWARIFASNLSTSPQPPDAEVLASIEETSETLDRVSARGAECFMVLRDVRRTDGRHLPIFRQGSRLGIEMIGNLLDRLYAKP
jgi:uncharacterized membrane protein YccC